MNIKCCVDSRCTLPNLVEIRGSLVVEYSTCNSDLSVLLPNLTVIRGRGHASTKINIGEAYGIVVRHTRLKGLGLPSLTYLNPKKVALVDNPRLCYMETIDWGALVDTLESNQTAQLSDILTSFGFRNYCPDQCPSNCPYRSGVNYKGRSCWSSNACQAACNHACSSKDLTCQLSKPEHCCHSECLGACNGPGSMNCVSCKRVIFDKQCLSRCPAGYYKLHGYRCVTRAECVGFVHLSMESAADEPAVANYSVFDGDCVHSCPIGYDRLESGECVLCPNGLCRRRDCGNVFIYGIDDLEKVRGCVQVRSLFVSLRQCDEVSAGLIEEAFSDLEEIHGSLHIVGSDGLSSLRFLRKLRTLHGFRSDGSYSDDHAHTSVEIAWNSRLMHLWSPAPSTPGETPHITIHSGRLVFTLNRNLCSNEILSFIQNHVRLKRNLTAVEYDIIQKSNGELAVCRVIPISTFRIVASQRLAFFLFTMPISTDSRQVLPPTIYYRTVKHTKGQMTENETVCANTWSVQEPVCRYSREFLHSQSLQDLANCSLLSLVPAAMYEAYIEIRIMVNRTAARTPVTAFTTYPDTPSTPVNVRAYATRPDFIRLKWERPAKPNGPIVHYLIWHRSIPLNPADYASKHSACISSTPIPSIKTQHVSANESVDAVGFDTPAVSASDFSKRSSVTDPLSPHKERSSCTRCAFICHMNTATKRRSDDRRNTLSIGQTERERREMILFEDRLQNLLLHPRNNPKGSPRFRRSVGIKSKMERFTSSERNPVETSPDLDRGQMPLVLFPLNTSSDDILTILVGNLSHFTDYRFGISACHDPHDADGRPTISNSTTIRSPEDAVLASWCSSVAWVRCRTLAIPDLDAVDPHSLEVVNIWNYRPACWNLDSHIECSIEMRTNVSRLNTTSPTESILSATLLTWYPPSRPNGFILYYQIRYRRVNADNKEQPPEWSTICSLARSESVVVKTDRRHSVVLHDLQSGQYEFQIMSVSPAGNSSWSSGRLFYLWSGKRSSVLDFVKGHFYTLLWTFLFTFATIVVVVIVFERCLARRRRATMRGLGRDQNHFLLSIVPDEWELVPEDVCLDMDRLLGQGSFGAVYQGLLRRLTTPAVLDYVKCPYPSVTEKLEGMDVAVKTVTHGTTLADIREFLSEAAFMKNFRSYHIVRMLGVLPVRSSGQYRSPAIVMELMVHGDLATYLRKRLSSGDCSLGSVPPTLALRWAGQLADGMAFLSSNLLIHRDLAARNCMVDGQLTVKIGDFGLARYLNSDQYYRRHGQGRLPVRWMSPESLRSAYYTVKSDVWSYGVVLWEIATFAALPYSGLSNDDVVEHVVAGGRLNLHDSSSLPSPLFSIMNRCWSPDPADRPTFEEILIILDPIMNDNAFRAVSYFHTERTRSGRGSLAGEH
ncbi:unnamed protein product [Calicophoron daubneyi]|uniref:receptor protein-tyrosine kinase n=1 Tax=Calicophoron daubneyi TaxID=300641 RepID=A0AAV2T1J1_CALDB